MKTIASVVALSLTILVGCFCCERWARADEFAGLLRCGMTETDIESLAGRFEGASVVHPEYTNYPEVVVNHEGTSVSMWFESGKLMSYQVSWIDKPTHVIEEEKKSLCDGRNSDDDRPAEGDSGIADRKN